MNDSKNMIRAEQVVRDWKILLYRTGKPNEFYLSCQDDLVKLIEQALEEKK